MGAGDEGDVTIEDDRNRRTDARRRLRVLAGAALVGFAGLLAACGSGAGGGSATRPTITAPSAATPTTAPGGSTSASGSGRSPATTAPSENPEESPTTTTPTTETPTTEPATTTTEEPTTTTTQEPPTTETPTTEVTPTTGSVHKSTTITAQSSTSSTPVGWIVGGVVLALLVILGIALLVRSRSRHRALEAWSTQAAPVLAQAAMVRDRLADPQRHGPADRAATSQQLQSVTTSLNRIASSAPSDEAAAAANAVAENMRSLSFAEEAADLLRSGPVPPTAEQLAQADQTSRTQLTQLDVAITGLQAHLEPNASAPRVG
jgi:hypothetical protein